MNEQETLSNAVPTAPEPSPYSELKQIIEEEQARMAHQSQTPHQHHSPTTQPSDVSRPTIHYGLD